MAARGRKKLTPCSVVISGSGGWLSRHEIVAAAFKEMVHCGYVAEAYQMIEKAASARPPFVTPDNEVIDELLEVLSEYVTLVADNGNSLAIVEPAPRQRQERGSREKRGIE